MSSCDTLLSPSDTSLSPGDDATSVPGWWRPSLADVAFLLVALAAFRGARHTLLDDPGLGWHLRNIDAIAANGWWLTADPFTEAGQGGARPYITNQWLGDLVLWLGWRWAGLEGIAVVNALILGLVARFLYRTFLADGLAWPVALGWTSAIMMGTSCSWNARPNVFSILFVLLTARALVLFHEGRVSRARTLWLLPLFAVWANTHGGFVAGLTLVGVALLAEVAGMILTEDERGRGEARGRAAHLALLSGLVVLATFVNPYGPGLYRWIVGLLGDRYFMELHQEWRSPDFHSAGAIRYEVFFLLFPLVLGLSKRRPSLVELGMAVLWLHFALGGFRYVALWVVLAGPLVARCSVQVPALLTLARRLNLSTGPGSLFATRAGAGAGWGLAWTGALAVALLGLAKPLEGRFARHKQEVLATAALDTFLEVGREWKEEHGRRPVLFHSYDWGGYLVWHGWPEFRNWIDDRNEVQGQQRVEDYFHILRAEDGWEAKLAETGADLVCIESGAALVRELAARPEAWKKRYRDDYGVVFERLR